MAQKKIDARVTVILSEEAYKGLEQLEDQADTTKSEIIRKAITQC